MTGMKTKDRTLLESNLSPRFVKREGGFFAETEEQMILACYRLSRPGATCLPTKRLTGMWASFSLDRD